MSTHEIPWPAGTPCWVDVSSTDLEASRRFYAELFGWEWEVGPAELGHYSTARLGGRRVAAAGPHMDHAAPPAWTTYLATEDIEATVAGVAEAGGTVAVPPIEIPGQGRMAMAVDVTGSAVGFWEAAAHTGLERANEPGAVVWNELHTPDLEATTTFYAAVSGFGYEPLEDAGDVPYAMFTVGEGTVVGGLSAAGETPLPGPASQWLTYFQVADVDATVAQTRRLGSTVVVEAHDSPFGRWAVVSGPDAEAFAVITPPADASGG